jgi:hypothetical protein
MTSVLIPWRTDHGPREAAFRHLLGVWSELDLEVCVGEDDPEGPFNFSRGLNRAYHKATSDHLVIFGADCVPDAGVLARVPVRLASEPWFPLFYQTGYYSQQDTQRILAGDPPAAPFEHLVPFCTGVLAFTREVFEAVGGMDERFAGWGMEDAALRRTLANLYGDSSSEPATLSCLWHPEDVRGKASERSWELIREYEARSSAEETRAYLDQRGSFL